MLQPHFELVIIFLCTLYAATTTVCLAAAAFTDEFGPITEDFEKWLQQNGYAKYDFVREDLQRAGSFGGRRRYGREISRRPIIFFHGNADSALRSNNFSLGWTNSVKYFLEQGYDLSELYGTSWGDTNQSAAVYRKHDCATTYRLRQFVEAVLRYTNAPQVDIIGHSMGVSLARKIVQGGIFKDDNQKICDLGEPLNDRVFVLLGISGANWGLCFCADSSSVQYPTCSHLTGFWPGDPIRTNGSSSPISACGNHNTSEINSEIFYSRRYSAFLMDINRKDAPKEATYIFSMWSLGDDLISHDDYVFGQPTSLIPRSIGSCIYTTLNHMQTKSLTASDQFTIITQQKIS